jgi:drug/metabolite transporter (DMT)-like permease
MIWLLLCIGCTAILLVLFREFGRRGFALSQVVALNYVVCLLTAFALTPTLLSRLSQAPTGPWLWLGLGQGVLFISLFNLTALAVQRGGVGYTGMVTKLSVVIPTLVSVTFLGENASPLQWAGLAVALLAIVLLHIPERSAFAIPGVTTPSTAKPSGLIWLGAVLFVGMGIVDSIFGLFDHLAPAGFGPEVFLVTVFATAAAIGAIFLLFQHLTGQSRFEARSLLGGLLLGVPNYLSIYFLLRGLAEVTKVVFFPLNNIGLLLVVVVIGWLIYKEALRGFRLGGVVLAVGAIALIAWGR